MNTNFLLLLLAPFIGFLFNVFFGKHRKISFWNHWNPCVFTFLASAYFFGAILLILQESKFHFRLDSNQQFQGRLFSIRPIIHFMVTVCNRNWFVNSYSISYMHDDENMHKYFAYLNLFIFFMITLVIGSNLLVLFIGWEGVGLCSYLLIGFGIKSRL
jgi:NADH-quinone oxidoreductase subunit L